MSVAAPDYLEAGHLLGAFAVRLGWEGDDEGALFHAASPEPSWVHYFVARTIADVARMTGTIKHFDIATKAAGTILASQRVSPHFVWSARASMALMAVQQGDTKAVQEQYTALKGERGTFGNMDVDHLLGILTMAIGESDQAVTYFEAALATWRKGRYPEYAWIAYIFRDTPMLDDVT